MLHCITFYLLLSKINVQKYSILYVLYEYFVLKILYFYCDINKVPLKYYRVDFLHLLNQINNRRISILYLLPIKSIHF